MTAQGVYQNFAIDRVVYGKPAAETLVAEAARLGAKRVFLLVSRTLDRETTWVRDMRTALGRSLRGFVRRHAVAHAASVGAGRDGERRARRAPT